MPWRGMVVAADRRRARGFFNLCVDTCIGRYDGRVSFRLVQVDGEWRLRARSGIGDGGLAINVEWVLRDADHLRIESSLPFGKR
jgi:hypothetical protein